MATWYTTDNETRLVDAWEDAPIENLEVLGFILTTARGQVIAYAPAPGDTDDYDLAPPDNLVLAQLQQSVNLWNAGRVTGSGDIGVDTYTFTPRPLDKTIRQIIRPYRGHQESYAL